MGIADSKTGQTVGVSGITNSPDGVGVSETNESSPLGDRVALSVFGRSKFSTIVEGSIQSGADTIGADVRRLSSLRTANPFIFRADYIIPEER